MIPRDFLIFIADYINVIFPTEFVIDNKVMNISMIHKVIKWNVDEN